MNATACDDRGADLFLAARGSGPDPDLAAHLAACAGCQADLERLRVLARGLPAASAGIAPLPATRAAVLADAALPRRAETPPLPRRLRGGPLRLLLPMAALAAGIGAVAFVLSRGPSIPRVDAPLGSVLVEPVWGGSAIDGLGPEGLEPGAILTARKVASVHVGPPFDLQAVLGEGTRLRITGDHSLELLEGIGWFHPAPGRRLLVVAGGLGVEGSGARFTVERRASGAAVVCVESGSPVLRSGGAEVTATGPSRVEIPAGGRPGAAAPADPSDASSWFARPEVLLEIVGGNPVVTLRPEVPAPLRVAPWSPLAPGFSLRAERAGGEPVTLPVTKGMILGSAPPADGDGAFLLSASRSYRITLDAGTLGLAPGTWSLSAVYAARGGSGLWQGTRSSKPVEWIVK